MTKASQPRLMITLATDAMGGCLWVSLEKYLHFCTDLSVDLEMLEDDWAARRSLDCRRSPPKQVLSVKITGR